MAAAKSAAGYDPKVVKLVGNNWVAPNQGYGPFGWVHNVLSVAQGTPNGLPDFVDVAPYTLNYLGNFDTNASNVATTGAPFLDEWAENANLDSVTTPATHKESMYLNQQYAKANFGVGTLVYGVNQSTLAGVAATQLQLDQIGASVGNALAVAEHILLMQRDAQVTGPIHAFTLAEPNSHIHLQRQWLCERRGDAVTGRKSASWPLDLDRPPAAPIPTGRWLSLLGSSTMPSVRTRT